MFRTRRSNKHADGSYTTRGTPTPHGVPRSSRHAGRHPSSRRLSYRRSRPPSSTPRSNGSVPSMESTHNGISTTLLRGRRNDKPSERTAKVDARVPSRPESTRSDLWQSGLFVFEGFRASAMRERFGASMIRRIMFYVRHMLRSQLSVDMFGGHHIREGLQSGNGAVILCNFSSVIDPTLAVSLLPLPHKPHERVVIASNRASDGVAVNAITDCIGAIRSLNRTTTDGAQKQVRGSRLTQLIAHARSGKAVFMFPEGKHVCAGTSYRIHGGAALVAKRANVPILPVYIGGTEVAVEGLPPPTQGDDDKRSVHTDERGRRPTLVRGCPVWLEVGEPIPPSELPDVLEKNNTRMARRNARAESRRIVARIMQHTIYQTLASAHLAHHARSLSLNMRPSVWETSVGTTVEAPDDSTTPPSSRLTSMSSVQRNRQPRRQRFRKVRMRRQYPPSARSGQSTHARPESYAGCS